MRVTTFNCNGIRSAARKGFFEWMEQSSPDILCLQEVRAHHDQLTDQVYQRAGYHCYHFEASRRGYSGTAIFSRREPDRVIRGFGWDLADEEARFIRADFDDLSVISLYMPSGSSGPVRQQVKMDCLARLQPLLESWIADGRHYIICGDWNMCHQPIDLKNWRSNQKNPGFLPEERAWLGNLFGQTGYVDAFRHLYPDTHAYSWWSNRGNARANNTGWRLDYHVITPGLLPELQSVEIYTEQNFSDHAPVTLSLSRKF